MTPTYVLVAGATGLQGGAVARLLLARGHRVRALTRRPGSPAAEALAAMGAEIAAGDFEDPSSLARAIRGVDAVFAMATPFEGGPEAEVRQGRELADAARWVGVQHYVYSSVAGADRRTGIPHFDSKARIEEHVRAAHLPYTVLAPVFFMENFISPASLARLRAGRLALPLPPARKLQQIALADLAAFTALVLERRAEFEGDRIELASDNIAGLQAAEVLTQATGTKIDYAATPLPEVFDANEDLGKMFDWLDRIGYDVDIDFLRRQYAEVGWHSFGEWAREQDWGTLRAGEAQPAGS